jgi:uncharacterized RDD family membrane protein YckC
MSEGGVSPLPREARPYQGKRAGLVTRGIAAVIDGVVVALVLLAGYVAWAGLLFLLDPRNFSFPDASLFMSLAAGFVVVVVYLTAAWWITGRSYGCLVMGLRVVNHRGERMRFGGALVRAWLCAVFPIGLLWIALSRENRSAQDLLLRTSVIYDWQPTGAPGRQNNPYEAI